MHFNDEKPRALFGRLYVNQSEPGNLELGSLAPSAYVVASTDRCTVHPQHVMVNQGRSEPHFADLFRCDCGKRAIGNTDAGAARRG
jgi:hypothetical protein